MGTNYSWLVDAIILRLVADVSLTTMCLFLKKMYQSSGIDKTVQATGQHHSKKEKNTNPRIHTYFIDENISVSNHEPMWVTHGSSV